ncbi:glucosyltransferase domain-containing protein [Candidatus Saccharibacteria bacterium]|nr:glucosyltransferase domain-containing protein [Candidatus Saccharibacteria bacterium]
MKGVKKYHFLVRPFLIMTAIYLVGILAIILASVHFADDVARTNYGYGGWNGFSRYVSTLLAYGIHTGTYFTNIAPLPQILAVMLLAIASVILVSSVFNKEIFKKKVSSYIWHLIAVVPLGLSPYMLECLSYQYDSIYMAISVLFAVLPLLFSEKLGWKYALILFVGVEIICMTYQAAVGIIPMLVFFLAAKRWNEDKKKNTKEVLKFVGFSAVVFLIALLVFKFLLMKPRDAYASNSLPEIQNFIPELFSHLGTYVSLVFSDFRVLWLVLIGVIIVAFIGLFIYRSKKNKIIAAIVGLVSLLLMFVMAFFFYAVLDKPLYATRAMYGVGAFIAMISLYVVNGKGREWLFKIPVTVLTYCFIVFALTYGNALKEQNEFRDRQISMVIQDLNDSAWMMNDTVKNIKVEGSIGLSPVILNMPQNYQMLNRLLMPSFSQYVPWMAYKLCNQSGIPNLYFNEDAEINKDKMIFIKETVFYSIMRDEQNILVIFNGVEPNNLLF